MRGGRVYTVLTPELLAALKQPKLARLLGQEVEITVRRVPTLEEVREMNKDIGDLSAQIIADRGT